MRDRLLRPVVDTVLALVDLVLPSACAGCDGPAPYSGVCAACADGLAGPPGPTRPTPAPDGLPPCLTLAAYEGVARELILAYKERGRRRLAAPLGDALAGVVLAGASSDHRPLVLVPVPATAAAIRARHGDHMLRLARRAARTIRATGRSVAVAPALRAARKEDAAHLDRHARARVAVGAFAARREAERIRPGALVVVLDDVVTTGSTIAAVTGRLAERGVVVAFAATLAATRLRRAGSRRPAGPVSQASPPPRRPAGSDSGSRIPWDGSWNWG
jgi:predicted amidophosphoribosyltransferase